MKKLPDHVKPGVKVLFVGINPGLRSAAVGHHFAGYSNRFWKLLRESNLVPVQLTYHDDWRLPEWGLGLTNLVSRATSGSNGLTKKDYKVGRARLASKIRRYRISIIALLGVTLCPIILPGSPGRSPQSEEKPSKITLGFQPRDFAGARVFLLPNPSGRNAYYSYADMLIYFRKLSKIVQTWNSKTMETRKS